MEYLLALNAIVYMISGAAAGYCFLRIFFYPILKLLVDETELYSNTKYTKSMKVFYHARLYPWPKWDEQRRSAWVRAWWKYALTGFAVAGNLYVLFVIICFILYLNRIKEIENEKKWLWRGLIVFGHVFAIPFFWYLYIFKRSD
jgi:hypothetical protein